FSGLLFYNRLLWAGVSLLISMIFYKLFKFSKAAPSISRKRKAAEIETSFIQTVTIPAVDYNYSFAARLKQWWFLVKFDFKGMIKAVPFIAITLCGILILLSNSTNIGDLYGTNSFPVTYMILDFITGNFILFIII